MKKLELFMWEYKMNALSSVLPFNRGCSLDEESRLVDGRQKPLVEFI